MVVRVPMKAELERVAVGCATGVRSQAGGAVCSVCEACVVCRVCGGGERLAVRGPVRAELKRVAAWVRDKSGDGGDARRYRRPS